MTTRPPDYAAHGWPVFPRQPGCKHPARRAARQLEHDPEAGA